MRILLAGNFQVRRYGAVRILSDRKMFYGLVRNGHQVQDFSDRDIAAFNAPFQLRDLGKGTANRRFLQTCQNFQPDLILLNHCDIIRNRTLDEARRILPGVKIGYRNVDALFVESNIARINAMCECVDHVFVTTGGEQLEPFRSSRAGVSFIPNPVDVSVETEDNSQKESSALEVDLLFCGNGSTGDPRFEYVQYLRRNLPASCRFDTYGSMGKPPVWGVEYERLLASTRMALNLNREECGGLYSSSRVAQLMGNGILTFIHRDSELNRLFGEDTAVYFGTKEELVEQITHFLSDDDARQRIAGKGRDLSFRHLSSDVVSQFIVEKTMGLPLSRDCLWEDDTLFTKSGRTAA